MTPDEWRAANDDILWKSMFVRELTDAVVDHGARDLIASRYADKSPRFYYDGIEAALRSDEVLTAAHQTPHSEPVFRDFLRRIRERMDDLRPWPTAPYARLPLDDWPRFADARAVATVPVRMGDAEQKLLVSAHRLPGGGEASVLMLRLGTGQEVALVGTPGIRPVTLLHRGSVDGDGPGEDGAASEGRVDRAGNGVVAGDRAVDGAGEGDAAREGGVDRSGSGRSAVEAFIAATGLPAAPVAAPRPWQGVLNGILYTLTFSRALDDAEVDRVVALIIDERSLPGGPARHRAAILQALASPGILDDSLPTRFSEAEFRDFLTRLLRTLDERER
jgi:hypothetical protein